MLSTTALRLVLVRKLVVSIARAATTEDADCSIPGFTVTETAVEGQEERITIITVRTTGVRIKRYHQMCTLTTLHFRRNQMDGRTTCWDLL